MRKSIVFLLVMGMGISGIFLAAQQEQSQPKFYIRATIYPTFSLSRYDYNNDIDHVEIRCYIEVRRDSVCGDIIDNATVEVNSEKLEFEDSQYKKRIDIDKETLTEKVVLKISIPEGINLERTYPVPDWLVIKSPQPSIIDSSQPLSITWEFQRCPGPVKVDAYNFRTGETLLDIDNFKENKIVIAEEKLPEKSLLRILVLHTWLYKQFIQGKHIARGSEVNFMPWSQVFIRTK
jgi:hypothetical protein